MGKILQTQETLESVQARNSLMAFNAGQKQNVLQLNED